jgi:protease-4
VSRTVKIIIAVVAVLVLLYAMSVLAVMALRGWDGGAGAGGGGTVGVLQLSGVVGADQAAGPFAAGGIDPVVTEQALRDADDDPGIDAVLLRVNSPGGSPAASWEVYQAIAAMEKPVVVSVADVTASGAYYFSSAADYIVAAPGSSVGSIGVILVAPDLQGLFEKVGVRYTVLTRGEYRDIGSLGREMTPAERDVLLQQMDRIYEQFIQDVAVGRDLEAAAVRKLATGLTYPGEEALTLGLVDEVGSYRDAVRAAAELAGLDPEAAQVRDLNPAGGSGLLDLLLGPAGVGTLRSLGREMAGGFTDGLQPAGGGGVPRFE